MTQNQKENILVIDDEKIFREVISEYLRRQNYDVTQADDGQKGIALAKKGDFNLVILDIYMPGLSGLDTLMAIKKYCPDLPVLMVTAKDSPEVYREAMRLGATEYLPKPISQEKLYRTLDIIFDRQRMVSSETTWLAGLERLRRGTEKLKKQLKLSQKESYVKKFDSFVQAVVALIVEVLQVQTVSVMTVDYDKQKMILKASHGLNPRLVKSVAKPIGEGIAGWVAQSGEPLLIRDVRVDSRFSESHFSNQYDTASLLCVPIIVNGRVEGVINVNNKKDKTPFDEKDLTLLTMFANNIEFAMTHFELYSQMEQRLRELALLYQINRRVTQTLDFDFLVEDLLQSIHEAFAVETSSIFLLNEDKKTMFIRSSVGKSQPPPAEHSVSMKEGLVGYAIRKKKSIIANDAQNTKYYSARIDSLRGNDTRMSMCVPLIQADSVLGVIEIINKKNGSPFARRDQSLLEAIASQTVLVLKNAWYHSTLSQKVKDILESQKRETTLKKLLKQKMDEIEQLKNNSFITFKIEDDDY